MSLPPSSSRTTNNSLYLSDHNCSATTRSPAPINPLSSSLPNFQSCDTAVYGLRDGSLLHPAIYLDNISCEVTSKRLDWDSRGRHSVKHSDLRSTSYSPSPLPSEPFPLPSLVSRTLFPEKAYEDSVGSVDWPPIGSTLYPLCGNVRHDEGIDFQVSDAPPRHP
jgi:hypothetical protein